MYRYGAYEVERLAVSPVRRECSEEADMTGIIDRVRSQSIEQVLLALDWSDRERLEELRRFFRVFPIPVRLIPDRSMRDVLKYTESATSLVVDLQREPLGRVEQLLKRLLDVTVAFTSLVVLSPILLLTAFLIRAQDGSPVIFRQRRMGFNNQMFFIYKFRSMRVMEDGSNVSQARRNDLRVTPLGKILRRTSIDELPQLFNVLKGDMSIVGPRPHAVAHDNEYGRMISEYAFRRHVKPGITGWAQVKGFRGETVRLEQMAKRVELDLWYINNWSIALDVHIIARTAFALARGRNAY
uniref:Sugar transferase n=1 Tax=Rhodopseudomonas palustris (strain BisA53) TaxID=316055 RepID=Q07SN8_RHOP5